MTCISLEGKETFQKNLKDANRTESQVCTLIIPELGWQRQKNCELKASLGDIYLYLYLSQYPISKIQALEMSLVVEHLSGRRKAMGSIPISTKLHKQIGAGWWAAGSSWQDCAQYAY